MVLHAQAPRECIVAALEQAQSTKVATEVVNLNGQPWSNAEDRIFETALVSIREDDAERWAKIASLLPGRTPNEVHLLIPSFALTFLVKKKGGNFFFLFLIARYRQGISF